MSVSDIVNIFRKRLFLNLGTNLVAVYWFGSTANKACNADSDIDLLVETTKPLTPSQRDQVADIAIDLCAESGLLLDIHYYTTKEMTHSPYSHSPFIESIMANGVRV